MLAIKYGFSTFMLPAEADQEKVSSPDSMFTTVPNIYLLLADLFKIISSFDSGGGVFIFLFPFLFDGFVLIQKEYLAQAFLHHMTNKTKLNAINSVDGNAEPKPKGAMATRKMIPPKIPPKKRILFINRKIPTRIWPKAIKETINDV